MLANVQQKTIRPIIEGVVAQGSRIHTDEYSIYARLRAWGYEHRTVCHGRGEYGLMYQPPPARDGIRSSMLHSRGFRISR
jgi:hypothetical protein